MKVFIQKMKMVLLGAAAVLSVTVEADETIKMIFEKALTRDDAVAIEKLLQEKKVDINYTDGIGDTPLIHAVKARALNVTKLLVENGADVNKQNKLGMTALYHVHCASYSQKDIDFAEILLDRGASTVPQETLTGWNMLHKIANEATTTELLKFVLKRNRKGLNMSDKNGDTPLHIAARRTHEAAIPIIRVLIDAGADKHIRNNKNETPVDVAKNKKIRKFLMYYNGRKENINYNTAGSRSNKARSKQKKYKKRYY